MMVRFLVSLFVVAAVLLLQMSNVEADSRPCSEVCAGAAKETPICATNGVQYDSSCRFECAKKKSPRLRIVQRGGDCSELTLKEYRQGQKRPN